MGFSFQDSEVKLSFDVSKFSAPASSLHVCRLNSRRKVSCVLGAPMGLYSEKDLQQRWGGVWVGGGRGNPLAWQSRGQRRLASR